LKSSLRAKERGAFDTCCTTATKGVRARGRGGRVGTAQQLILGASCIFVVFGAPASLNFGYSLFFSNLIAAIRIIGKINLNWLNYDDKNHCQNLNFYKK